MPTIDKYAEGGINYFWPSWSNSSGYKSPTEWEAYGVVGLGDERQARVGVGMDGDGLDAEATTGREDPARDLATVGDEESTGHVRNTPNPLPPVQCVLLITLRQIASTVRVSRGSMTPSSYNIPESA